MSKEEKGIREMFGEPCGRSGKPKQDADRGTENFKGPVLRENGIMGWRRFNLGETAAAAARPADTGSGNTFTSG